MSASSYARSSFRSAGSRVAPWTPASMDGVLVYLDAATEAAARGLGSGDTAALTTWSDRSGNDRHATTYSSDSTPTLEYAGGRWGLTLTADAPRRMQLPEGSVPLGDTPYSIVIVAQTNKAAPTDTATLLFAGGPPGAEVALQRVMLKQNTSMRLNSAWYSSNLFSSNDALTAGEVLLLQSDYDLTGRTQYIGGDLAGSDSATGRDGRGGIVLLFGENTSATYWAGTVHSIIVFDHELTEGERTTLNAYLGDRYSIPALTPLASFGFVTDLHNADLDPSLGRYYRDVPEKLTAAVATWNARDLDFVHMNGDYIDAVLIPTAEALADLAEIEAVFQTATAPQRYVVGNHDLYTLTRAEWLANSGMSEFYYSFDINGVHFVALDACYNSDNDADPYDAGYDSYATSYIPPAQRTWLTADLAANELPVVVFCHQRLDGTGAEAYVVNNAPAVRTILEADGNTIAVFTGHAHENLKVVVNSIPYLVCEALADGAYPTNAYGVVSIYPSHRIVVEGFGNQASYDLPPA